jgi:hypothetical protein
MPSEQVNTMRFRSELLQPPAEDSETTLTRIYDVYRAPAGHIEGQDEDIAEILERDAEVLGRLGSSSSRAQRR